jgi:hypothetical protein
MFNPIKLLADYNEGCGYKKGDVLVLRAPDSSWCQPFDQEIIDGKWVVLEQSCLAKHKYIVLGERIRFADPADRFLKTEINGHNYRKV